MAKQHKFSALLPAVAAFALVLLHLLGQEPAPAGSSAPQSARDPADVTQVDPFAGLERDDDEAQAFKDEFMPSVLDVGPGRAEKEFYKRMKVLGSSPIETVEGEPGNGLGLIIGEDGTGFAEFLKNGGHYSGRLPAALAPEGARQNK